MFLVRRLTGHPTDPGADDPDAVCWDADDLAADAAVPRGSCDERRLPDSRWGCCRRTYSNVA